jgi:hypothetical protein
MDQMARARLNVKHALGDRLVEVPEGNKGKRIRTA